MKEVKKTEVSEKMKVKSYRVEDANNLDDDNFLRSDESISYWAGDYYVCPYVSQR